ncbi:MAG: polyamine aminopropyltransferase, partial [Planctomycetia bacterium]
PLLPDGVLRLRLQAVGVAALLVVGLFQADHWTRFAEDGLFAHPILHAETTHYQRIVVTGAKDTFQLHLNGNLQFHSADEYRYHEALVHPAFAVAPHARRVLVLGGGDGLAVREILKYPAVRSIVLVDIDPAMTDLARRLPPLAKLNGNAFDDPRTTVVNDDAMVWVARADVDPEPFDLAVIDFPDPNSFSLGKLYTTRFFRLLVGRLRPGAAVAMQCTSPWTAPRAYWCIVRTLESAGYTVRPYVAAVPSFGLWGFALAKREPFPVPSALAVGLTTPLRSLDDVALARLFELPPDLAPVEVEINRLDDQRLVRYYEAEWGAFAVP